MVITSQLPVFFKVEDFFVGWEKRPSQNTFQSIIAGSTHSFFALDDERPEVLGFIVAISDKTLFAHITLLEVSPKFQNRGVGSLLTQAMIENLKDLYAIDLVCDEDLVDFYERLGLKRGIAMTVRNYINQVGGSDEITSPPPSSSCYAA